MIRYFLKQDLITCFTLYLVCDLVLNILRNCGLQERQGLYFNQVYNLRKQHGDRQNEYCSNTLFKHSSKHILHLAFIRFSFGNNFKGRLLRRQKNWQEQDEITIPQII